MDQINTQEIERELENGEYNYFRSVFKQLEHEFSDRKDFAVYIRNVFKAMAGHELQISCHPNLSLSLEQLLPYGSPVKIAKFFETLSDHFLHLSTHSSGSHILQSLLEISLTHITDTGTNIEKYPSSINMLSKLVRRYGRFVHQNLDILLKEVHACHLIGKLLETLSGYKTLNQCVTSESKTAVIVGGKVEKAKKQVEISEIVEVPKKFILLCKKLTRHLLENDCVRFKVLKESHISKIIPTIILILSRCDPSAFQHLLDIMVNMLFNEESNAIFDCCYAPMIEKIFAVCSPAQYSTVWTAHFKGQLSKYLLHPIANYVGQHLIKYCPTKTEFEEIFEETSSFWDKIFDLHYLGVLVALSEACVKLNCCQAKFVEQLARLLHCSNPISRKLALVPLTARCVVYEKLNSTNVNDKINLHGSLLIQQMLNFQKPLTIVDSLLSMDISEIDSLLCNQIGSHILDAFATSKTVGQKNKQRFLHKLKGNLTILACDKYAIFCLDKLWKSVDHKTKLLMMEDLADNDKKLKKDKYGRIVYNSFAVYLFKSRRKDWEQWQMQGDSKRKRFQDILPSKKQKCF